EEIEEIIKKWKREGKEKKKTEDPLKDLKKNIKKISSNVSKVRKFLGFDFALSRGGPYEHNFLDRIANIYLAPAAINYYVPHISGYLIGAAGVGK
ncbi:MAG: hypothetical protein KAU95_02735, partial [Candidatus Aenigmarchaeota archaeon]|nr:hypothetical protein [Candidatus Aenigmarchaeota archaeon]